MTLIGLAALNDSDAVSAQPLVTCPRASAVGAARELEDVIEVEDMRAVEVRRAVAIAQIERIVAVVEEAHGALLVE